MYLYLFLLMFVYTHIYIHSHTYIYIYVCVTVCVENIEELLAKPECGLTDPISMSMSVNLKNLPVVLLENHVFGGV